jgi:hypothetical protein
VESLLDLPDSLDLGDEALAIVKESFRIHRRPDSGRCAGEDKVARSQFDNLR